MNFTSTITTEEPKKCARNIQGGSMMKAIYHGKGKCVDFSGFAFFLETKNIGIIVINMLTMTL